MKQEWLSHAERRERRKKVAADIKAGGDMGEIAEKHGVSVSVAWEACRQHKVSVPRKASITLGSRDTIYQVIARIQQGETQIAIARSLNVTHQAVNSVVMRCRKHGVNLNGANDDG